MSVNLYLVLGFFFCLTLYFINVLNASKIKAKHSKHHRMLFTILNE